MILAIKIIKFDPAKGKPIFLASQLEPLMSIDIDEYVKSVKLKMFVRDEARAVAVTEIIEKLYDGFNLPVCWQAFSADDRHETAEQLYFPTMNEKRIDMTLTERKPHPAISSNKIKWSK